MDGWRTNRRGALVLIVALVGASFGSSPAAERAEAEGNAAVEWARAKPLLRPKLLPTYFIEAFPGLIHRPFSAELVIAYSLDRGQTDEYLRETDSAIWKVTLNALHAQALANLEDMSRDLPTAPQTRAAEGGALVINKDDGYDAARILLPGLRSRLLAVLGPEVFAGVPARDLLMLWSPAGAKRQRLDELVTKEWTVRPHALSNEVFSVTADLVVVASARDLAR